MLNWWHKEKILNYYKLSDIATIYNGNSINKTEKKQKYMMDVPGWNYIGTKDVDFDGKVTYKNGVIIPYSESKFRVAPAGTVLVCSEGGSAGRKTAIITEDVCFGNKLFAIVNDKGKYVGKYIYYYTRYSGFTKQFKLLATSLMGGISGKNFGTIRVPLPSIPEQERIVSRIEELFSELDKSVETLQTIKRQLAVYRQAVLTKEFTLSSCPVARINDICDNIVDCPHSTPKWSNAGYLCLRTTNFKRGFLDLSKPNYVSKDTFNNRNKRLIPKSGDVLYSREGSILGIACIIPAGLEVCLGQRMMLLRASEKLNNKFLMYYLNSPMVTNHVISSKGGTGSPHINVGDIKEFLIPFPDIKQQCKIVEVIEEKLSVCDSIEQTVDAALTQAEAMRQSILKKAFEGGLSK